MIHIRECSDLHLEFYYDMYEGGHSKAKEELLKLLPALPTDKKTVLVVAGDLATARRAGRIVTFMEMVVPRFKHVIYVLGNHESYNEVMVNALSKIAIACEGSSKIDMKKLTIAGNDPVKVEIGGVRFLCGTMWTDYGVKRDNVAEIRTMILSYITDHRVMLNPDKTGVMPFQCHEIYDKTIAKFGEWMKDQDNSKTVIVTHHMPTFHAVDPQYTVDKTCLLLNHAFSAELDDFILEHQPALWFFGHTHTAWYGKIGSTQLHCNPLGYPREPTAANNRYDTTKIYSL